MNKTAEFYLNKTKMYTRQTQALKEELQLMRDALMKDMKIILEDQLLDKMKTMVKNKLQMKKIVC